MTNTCDGYQHDWVEDYYGTGCQKCGLWFAFGCAPWDEPVEDEYDEDWED